MPAEGAFEGEGRKLLWRVLHFDPIADSRGSLISLEFGAAVPFFAKRVYYIYATAPEVRRGAHAHRALRQVMVAVHGSCKVVLDDRSRREVFELRSCETGLYLGPGVWREMYDFSPDCVLMVLASEHYEEADYIRNYDDFLAMGLGRSSGDEGAER